MKLQTLSDLHTELYKKPSAFAGTFSIAPEIDVLVLAGDIVDVCRQSPEEVTSVLGHFCQRAPNVVYVTGNHEYWGYESAKGTREKTHALLAEFSEKNPNFHWLNNSEVTLDGQHFVGGSLWFTHFPGIELYEKGWSDFKHVSGLSEWVYKSNRAFHQFAMEHVREDTIVVTHHLPNRRSVHPTFHNDPGNIFFVSDMTEVIYARRPKLWFHGHTHCSVDYNHDATRVICNPFGYPHIINREYETLVIEN